MHSSTNVYLSALAVWDSLVLVCTLLLIGAPGVITQHNWYMRNVFAYVVSMSLSLYGVPVYGVSCTVFGVRCTPYSVHCTVYAVHCTVYGVQCTLLLIGAPGVITQHNWYMRNVFAYVVSMSLSLYGVPVYSIQCTVYGVHCTVYGVQCTLLLIGA